MGSVENMTLDNTGVHKTLDTLDRDENMTPPRIEFTHHTTVALSSGCQFVKLALYSGIQCFIIALLRFQS